MRACRLSASACRSRQAARLRYSASAIRAEFFRAQMGRLTPSVTPTASSPLFATALPCSPTIQYFTPTVKSGTRLSRASLRACSAAEILCRAASSSCRFRSPSWTICSWRRAQGPIRQVPRRAERRAARAAEELVHAGTLGRFAAPGR